MAMEFKVKDEVVDPEYDKIMSQGVPVKSEPRDVPEDFFDDFEDNQFLDELVTTVRPNADLEDVISEGEIQSDHSMSSEPSIPPNNVVANNQVRSRPDTPVEDEDLSSEATEELAKMARLAHSIEHRRKLLNEGIIKLEKISPPKEHTRKRSPSPFTRRIKKERISPSAESNHSTSRQSASRQSSTSSTDRRKRSRSRSPRIRSGVSRPKSPTRRRSRSPGPSNRRSRSPSRRLSRSPVPDSRYSRSPKRRRSRSPVPTSRHSRSPKRQQSRSPSRHKSSRSPVRRRSSRSPIRNRSRSSGRRRSRSPARNRSRSPERRRSRSPHRKIRSKSREKKFCSDNDFQKERERLLEKLRENKSVPVPSTSASANMSLLSKDVKLENYRESESTIFKNPVALRVMPLPVICKTEPVDPDEMIAVPTSREIKKEKLDKATLSNREKAFKFCQETLENFKLFEKFSSKRFLYTPTFSMREEKAESRKYRSPLNQGTSVQFEFSSTSLPLDMEKFGICKLTTQTANIVQLISFNANEIAHRIRPKLTIKSDTEHTEVKNLPESTYYANAETQTTEKPCRQCLARQLKKSADKVVQVSLSAPVESKSILPAAFDSISRPLLTLIAQLMPGQQTALKEFAELIQGPAPTSSSDVSRSRERLNDIFTLAQSQSNKTTCDPLSSPTAVPMLYNQSNQSQQMSNVMFNSNAPLPVPSPYIQQNNHHQNMMQPRFPYSQVNNQGPMSAAMGPITMGPPNHIASNNMMQPYSNMYQQSNVRPLRVHDPRSSRFANVNMDPHFPR